MIPEQHAFGYVGVEACEALFTDIFENKNLIKMVWTLGQVHMHAFTFFNAYRTTKSYYFLPELSISLWFFFFS